MSDETDSEIRERIKGIFPDPTTASRVVEMVVSKRPLGWSRKSVSPYYAKQYADRLKPYVDQMIQTNEDIIYYYADFCKDISEQTFYQRIVQSARFLIERMDTPDKKYAQWWEQVHVNTKWKGSTGLQLTYLKGVKDGSLEKEKAPIFAVSKGSMPLWRVNLEEWLESDDTEPYVKEGLALSKEDQVALKKSIAEIPTVQCSVTATSVKAIKLN